MADIIHSSETCTTCKCCGSWSRTENHNYFGHGPVYKGSQATKVESRPPNKFIMCIGQFHTVLCAVGSSIENNGIDDAWVESGL